MAQTTRERIIANRGRRKMSAKQIRIFGTPAQKARLRGSRKRSTRKNARHRPRSRKNSGEIIGYTFAQPARKNRGRKNMAKSARRTHKRRAHRTRVGHRVNRRRNTGRRNYTHHRRRRVMHRRNPGVGGMGRIGGIAINAVFVIAGALGSKLLAQMVLGANNTGAIGYAANAIAGGVLWFLAEKVMHNKDAANGIIAGTAVQIILRLINDYTPFGSYVSQLGMGDYQAQAFVTPQVLVDPFNSARIQIPAGWAPAVAMPAAVGVSGVENLYNGSGSSLY